MPTNLTNAGMDPSNVTNTLPVCQPFNKAIGGQAYGGVNFQKLGCEIQVEVLPMG